MMASAWFATIGLALVGIAIGALAWRQVNTAGTILHRLWPLYEARLHRDARFLLWRLSGARIARMQAMAILALVFVVVLMRTYDLLWLLPPAAFAPLWWLARSSERKRFKIDAQLPVWLLALANALKATPSIGEALASSSKLVPSPLQAELELSL
jgi:tight adherence protein B